MASVPEVIDLEEENGAPEVIDLEPYLEDLEIIPEIDDKTEDEAARPGPAEPEPVEEIIPIETVTNGNGNEYHEPQPENDTHDKEDEDSRMKLQTTSVSAKNVGGGGGKVEIARKNTHFAHVSRQILKSLRQYFQTAFTILVKKRRLAPSDAFIETNVFGINVPKFAHPASLEYVDEISKKMVTLLVRNVMEGCVMHVMIEKNKTSHVIQRFVFRTVGTLDLQKLIKNSGEDFDLEEARNQFRESLLHILNQNDIKPILIPQFSRWSISIGLKPEFVESTDSDSMTHLWQSDTSSHYFFPWKERPRNPAHGPMTVMTPSSGEVDDDQSQSQSSVVSAPPPKVDTKAVETMKKLLAISDPAPTLTPVPDDSDSNGNNLGGTICLPISSFAATSELMISVYSLEYPAPTPGPVIRNLSEGFTRGTRTFATPTRSTHGRYRYTKCVFGQGQSQSHA